MPAKTRAAAAANPVVEEVQKDVAAATEAVQEAATQVKQDVEAAVTPKEPSYMDKGKEAVHDAVETAKKTAEPYVEAAVDAAKPYVEGAKASVHNMREMTAEKVEAAKKTAEPYVEAAKDVAKPYVEGAKASAANVRDHVNDHVQDVKDFDITKTAVFVQVAQLVAYLIFTLCQLFQSNAQLRVAEAAVRSKAEAVQAPSIARKVGSTVRSVVQQVPLVGVRTVQITDAFVEEVDRAISENRAHAAAVNGKKTD